jgi:murein peptide amidase A
MRGSPLALALSALSLLAPAGEAVSSSADLVRRAEVLGESVRGRTIRAVEVGDRASDRKILVVGCIHGNECAGIAVTRLLARGPVPTTYDLWIVHNINPDGYALGVRQNARGVDLNRNFPSEWKRIGERWDPQYSGPRPLSEPETRIARRLVLRLEPDVTLWFHQPQALVRAWGQSIETARRYARLARVPYRSIRWPAGTAPNWQNHRFPGTASFVVELPSGPLSAAAAARYARAVRLLAARG